MTDSDGHTLRRDVCLRLFLSAVGARLALLVVALLNAESIDIFLSQSDAGSFLRMARWIFGGAEFAEAASGYHTRVFLGWPLMFGWTQWLGLERLGLFALALVLAGLTPCLYLLLSKDRTGAWLLCFATPAWVVYSIHPMSEPAFLAAGLGSLALLCRRRYLGAGLLLGLMATIRPHALALLVGQAIWLWRDRRGLPATAWFRYGVGLTAGPVLFLALNFHLYDDLWQQARVYGESLDQLNVTPAIAAAVREGGHWGPPFYWLIQTPRLLAVPLSKALYIYAHAAFLLVLSALAIDNLLRRRLAGLDLAINWWWLVNGLLIASAGPYWGFFSFDRYFVWAWPAGLWVLRDRLRSESRLWWAAGSASAAAAVFLVLRK